jgi:uroporphyrinogen-III synthase
MATFITTEPNIITGSHEYDASKHIVQKWREYWKYYHNKTNIDGYNFTDIYHLPLSSIQYSNSKQDLGFIDNKYDFDAILFISPNAIKSFYQISKINHYTNNLTLLSKNIWLIGQASYEVFCQYYNPNEYKITYVNQAQKANIQQLFYLLENNHQLFNQQNILVIKGNLGNSWFYEQLEQKYNANIKYIISYIKTYTQSYLNYNSDELKGLHEIAIKDNQFNIYISSSDTLAIWHNYFSRLIEIYPETFTQNIQQTIYIKHASIQAKAQKIFTQSESKLSYNAKVVLIDDFV